MMKARVKATGEIVEVTRIIDRYVMTHHPHTTTFGKDELDFDIEDNLDYWTRLEHQCAGMAMQSYVSNNVYLTEIRGMCKEPQEMRDLIADLSILLATTLVQKLKEKEERK